MTQYRLAIHDATPTFPEGPPAWPRTSERIAASIQAAIETGDWGKYESPLATRLEEAIQKQFATESVMLCSSGTIGVELALRGVGIKPGDEVLLAGYDFPGNFRAIEAIGARPVLVDVQPNGWLMDLEKVESAISAKTRAVLVSHLHGQILNLDHLKTIVEPHKIKVIEDTCQSPGACSAGRPLGSLGDVGVLSFGGSKLLTAGRGGAILTNDPSIIQRARIFANRGNDAFPFSQLQAAALLPQIEELEQIANQRHRGTSYFWSQLAEDCPELVSTHFLESNQSRFAPFKLPLLVKKQYRKPMIECLTEEGVLIGEGFRGFSSRTERRCGKPMDLSNSRRAANETLILHHPVLLESEEYLSRLSAIIAKVYRFVSEQVQ